MDPDEVAHELRFCKSSYFSFSSPGRSPEDRALDKREYLVIIRDNFY